MNLVAEQLAIMNLIKSFFTDGAFFLQAIVAGVVGWGISYWSVPAAIIVSSLLLFLFILFSE